METERKIEISDTDYDLMAELEKELTRMEERGGKDRDDPKFLILKKLIEESKTQNKDFSVFWQELSNTEKHAIITRLKNIAYFISIEEQNPQKAKKFVDETVRPLSEKLYGLLKDEDGHKVNTEEKFRLEKELNK